MLSLVRALTGPTDDTLSVLPLSVSDVVEVSYVSYSCQDVALTDSKINGDVEAQLAPAVSGSGSKRTVKPSALACLVIRRMTWAGSRRVKWSGPSSW